MRFVNDVVIQLSSTQSHNIIATLAVVSLSSSTGLAHPCNNTKPEQFYVSTPHGPLIPLTVVRHHRLQTHASIVNAVLRVAPLSECADRELIDLLLIAITSNRE